MARIRSIKPEFWTDPHVVGLSMAARLLFVGCWNHADDYGVLKDDPDRLKLQILPGDDVDPGSLVDELVDANLVLRRVAPDGTAVLVVRTFCEHQRIDKRSTGRWGHPDDFTRHPAPSVESRESPTTPAQTPQDATDSHPGLSSSGFGTDGTFTSVVPPEPTSLELAVPDVSPPATDPASKVFEAWIEAAGKTGRTVLTPERRRLILKQLKDYPLDDVLDAVRGWRWSAHHRGENDRGTVYNDLELVLRDAKHVEMFRDLERNPPEKPLPRGMQGIADWLQKVGTP